MLTAAIIKNGRLQPFLSTFCAPTISQTFLFCCHPGVHWVVLRFNGFCGENGDYASSAAELSFAGQKT
jgi:hypothetical protein